MKSRAMKLAAALALVVVAATFLNTRIPSARQEAILDVCNAVEEERYEEALAASEGLVGPDHDGFVVAECRCWALLSLGERDACAGLIDQLLIGNG